MVLHGYFSSDYDTSMNTGICGFCNSDSPKNTQPIMNKRPCGECNNIPPRWEKYTTKYCALCTGYYRQPLYFLFWEGLTIEDLPEQIIPIARDIKKSGNNWQDPSLIMLMLQKLGKPIPEILLQEHPLPGVIEQATNLAKATVQHTTAGMANVTQEEHDRRMNICKGCEFFRPSDNRCGKCGCKLMVKVWWKEQKCPLDPPKW